MKHTSEARPIAYRDSSCAKPSVAPMYSSSVQGDISLKEINRPF